MLKFNPVDKYNPKTYRTSIPFSVNHLLTLGISIMEILIVIHRQINPNTVILCIHMNLNIKQIFLVL